MTVRFSRRAFTLAALCAATPLHAAPQSYRLDRARSSVRFSYQLNDAWSHGTIPIKNAEIAVDLNNLRNSAVRITLSADQIQAGFVLATQALKGADMLDTKQFPDIRFESRRVVQTPQGADVVGPVTIRGVTQEERFLTRYLERVPTAVDREIGLQIDGELNRHDYAASGYQSFVGPGVALRIRLYLIKV